MVKKEQYCHYCGSRESLKKCNQGTIKELDTANIWVTVNKANFIHVVVHSEPNRVKTQNTESPWRILLAKKL